MSHISFRHASALTAVALIGAFGSGMGAQAEVAPADRAAVGGIISITSPEPEVVIGHLRDHLGAVGLPIGPDDGTVFHFDGAGWIGIVTQSDATTTVNWSVAR